MDQERGREAGGLLARTRERARKCENKNFADRRPKKNIFPIFFFFKNSCFHELKGPSGCAFPVSDQNSTKIWAEEVDFG